MQHALVEHGADNRSAGYHWIEVGGGGGGGAGGVQYFPNTPITPGNSMLMTVGAGGPGDGFGGTGGDFRTPRSSGKATADTGAEQEAQDHQNHHRI